MHRSFNLPETGSKVLLINSHAYDVRLPWWKYHQPTGLLKLGSLLKKRGCDVRFIDCLHWQKGQTVTRRKIDSLIIDGYEFDVWRFGALWGHLTEHIRELKASGFEPDYVYVSCFQTAWWKAAHDLIDHVKEKWFRKAVVVLGGVYPVMEPDHARSNTNADVIFDSAVPEAVNEVPDFSLYDAEHRPGFAGLNLFTYQGNRSFTRKVDEITQEVLEKQGMGVSEFAFFDDLSQTKYQAHFKNVLRSIIKLQLDIRFVALGNLSPKMIDAETAHLMDAVGYKQIYLKCDVKYSASGATYASTFKEYSSCTEALTTHGGFRQRSGDVTAMLLVGHPYEDIELITERLIKLSSIVGAVSLVQYQYTRNTPEGKLFQPLVDNSELGLDELNCKFYPFARITHRSLEDYLELTRLAALLNSKYRSKTFDFLGESIVSKAIQESIGSQSWQPRLNGNMRSEPIDVPLDTIPWVEGENHDSQA